MAEPTTIVAPAFAVATAADARPWCRIDTDAADSVLTELIATATQYAGHITERALLRQTLEIVLDAFPADGIELKRTMKDDGAKPTIVSVTYVDPDGVTQTMPSGDYYLDDGQTPCWLLPAVGTDWPSTREQANAVVVQYTAGFDSDKIPPCLLSFVKANVAYGFENPKLGDLIGERLLDPLRTWGV
jgi:uncharacterized phiE125 gp8 family phage protein